MDCRVALIATKVNQPARVICAGFLLFKINRAG